MKPLHEHNSSKFTEEINLIIAWFEDRKMAYNLRFDRAGSYMEYVSNRYGGSWSGPIDFGSSEVQTFLREAKNRGPRELHGIFNYGTVEIL